MLPYVQCSIIYHSQDIEATQLSINRGMDKDVTDYTIDCSAIKRNDIFFFFLNLLFCMGVQPINNAMIVSGEQWRDSTIHIHVCIVYLYVYALSPKLPSPPGCHITLSSSILPFVTTWMDPDGIMLNEISQTGKNKYCMLSLICGI